MAKHGLSRQKTIRSNIQSTLATDMLKFGKVTMPTMFSEISPPFHNELVSLFIDPKIKKMNIIAPRGHAKSSIGACVFPLHHIFFEKGDKFIVLSSKTQGHAIDLLQSIKDVLDYSMEFRAIFGYWGQHSAKVWTKDRIVLKDNTIVICKGTGQQVRGLKHGNQRPTLFILDDPEDENNTKTKESMEWNLRWLLQGVEPSLDAKRGRLMVIGTPQHENCMIETLASMVGWHTLKYQALSDDETTALWPELWNVEQLLQKKKELESINRLSVFYREYQCRVVGDEDQLFKAEYIQYYEGFVETQYDDEYAVLNLIEKNGVKYRKPLKIPVYIFMGVDPASSTKQTADYSTIVPIAVDSDNNRYVLPFYRKHARPMELAESILRLHKKYNPRRTHIESVGYQEMLRDYLRDQPGYIPGLEKKINPRTSKSFRLETMEPYFYKRKVFLSKDMSAMKDELLMYPRGKHDDLLDGLYYAMLNLYKPFIDTVDSFINQEDQGLQKTFDWAVL
tara:strand:- start:4082 stop:5599 length:1518 start_codon:yes stop_codon:yes gene_type:complete